MFKKINFNPNTTLPDSVDVASSPTDPLREKQNKVTCMMLIYGEGKTPSLAIQNYWERAQALGGEKIPTDLKIVDRESSNEGSEPYYIASADTKLQVSVDFQVPEPPRGPRLSSRPRY